MTRPAGSMARLSPNREQRERMLQLREMKISCDAIATRFSISRAAVNYQLKLARQEKSKEPAQ